MASSDYSQIRRELEQLHQGSPKADRKSPLFDFGLFILTYFFALVVVVTVLLAVGVPLQQYTVFYAIPLAWLGIAWFRKAPFYALMIAALGVLFLAACSLFVSQYFDVAWDSNCYHKADTGMLVYGWNPLRQTMTSFANSTNFLPYNSQWLSYQVDNQPKASFIIGASFYAFTGNIAYGKVFNIASMVACICIVAPMLRDAFRLNPFAAFLSILVVSVNPITLGQSLTYYNDGFVFQMLTITAASFCYLAYKPDGRYARMAKVAAFAAVCLAVNIKTSAVLFCTIICLFYYIARVIAIAQTDATPKARKKQQLNLFLYFASMVVVAICVLGATTYITNLARYGNPFYGMLGSSSINTLLESLMSPKVHRLPLFMQFFVSLFSPSSNELFNDIVLKVPFTFSQYEWNLQTLDANVSGWGIIFSGIFLISLAVVLRAVYVMAKRRTRKTKFLIIVLLNIFLPVFFIPYLFSARYFLQLFWLPLLALICLFAAPEDDALAKAKQSAKVWMRLLGVVLCVLLAFNCITAYNYLQMQMKETAASRKVITSIINETENNGKVMDFTPMTRGLFYALIFNLKDEGVEKYNFVEHLPDNEIAGNVLYYLAYRLRNEGSEATSEANSFLMTLNSNGYIVVIAKQGACGALDNRMLVMLDTLALRADEHDSLADNYLTVIDTNAHIRVEKSGPGVQTADIIANKLPVQVQSALSGASIVIDGTEYALARDGYNIVVYDPVNMALVDSVVINTNSLPILSR